MLNVTNSHLVGFSIFQKILTLLTFIPLVAINIRGNVNENGLLSGWLFYDQFCGYWSSHVKETTGTIFETSVIH